MSVDIEPSELSFRRPFTVEVSQILTIKNPTSSPLAFKVKTTAPKQYCVRPNAGRIEPGQDFDVTVLLQAMKADPPADTRCRDKFLVQSAPITPDKEFAAISSVVGALDGQLGSASINQLTASGQLDATDKSQIQERKIRVNWLAANGGHDQASNSVPSSHGTPNRQSMINGLVSETPEASRTYMSPKNDLESTPVSAPPAYTSDETRDVEDRKSDPSKSAASPAAGGAGSDSAKVTLQELKAKLAKAEAELVNLKDSGLRQRNVKAATEEVKKVGGQTVQAVKQADGVPVQVVAMLCLMSFLLAYFFF
ncbi:PapD-like protein [Drechmeria coniospora]|uniref:PapD-like protein n=1 Tax=Drechmeria coniospora TaxID=98403 RepID=A0A151GU47_DRECN|nr:PapD-like protein [Drechmeria coniospora]KYK60600.1 PapD-like protein [Drechmeria coniospora]